MINAGIAEHAIQREKKEVTPRRDALECRPCVCENKKNGLALKETSDLVVLTNLGI